MSPIVQQQLRLLFWGMPGQFSTLVLEGLLDAGFNVCATVMPASARSAGSKPIVRLYPEPPRSQLPIKSPYLEPNISHLAWQNQIPVFQANSLRAPEVIQQMAAIDMDVSVAACFPNLIPQKILAMPRHGFLNLHPSLLPDNRGPFPLFWSFRLGRRQSGVTVHHMDTGLDTGAIALQQELLLPDGISGPEADALFARHGALLMVDACHQLAAGTLPRRPQPPGGSRYSRPTAQDFQISTTWSACHAFNFMVGTAEWRQPFRILGSGFDLSLRQALAYDATASQVEALRRDGRGYWIQFNPGVLHVR